MVGRLDDALDFYETSLRLRAQRQQVLASNIANADTPNYKAQDIDFRQALAAATSAASSASTNTATNTDMVTTNPGHMSATGSASTPQLITRAATQSSQDGNTVDVDTERSAFAENAMQYEVSLSLATAQIKNLNAVLQG